MPAAASLSLTQQQKHPHAAIPGTACPGPRQGARRLHRLLPWPHFRDRPQVRAVAVQASQCGCACLGPGPGAQARQLWPAGSAAPPPVGSPRTQGQSRACCPGRWVLFPLSPQGSPQSPPFLPEPARSVTDACGPSATTAVRPHEGWVWCALRSVPPPAPSPGSCRAQTGFLSPRSYLLHASIRTGPCRLCGWVLRLRHRPIHLVVGACVCRTCLSIALQTHQLHPRIPVALQPHQQLLARVRFLIKFQSFSCGILLCVSYTEGVASRCPASFCRAVCVSHTCPCALPPGPACRPPGRQSAEASPVLPSGSPLAVPHTAGSVSLLLPRSLPRPHPCPQARSLRPSVGSCPADGGVGTTFLDSTHMRYSVCVSLSDVLHSVCVSHSVVSDSTTPWTVAHQAPLSVGFSRQECCSGTPVPSPGDLPNPGIKPRSSTLQADSLPSEPPGKSFTLYDRSKFLLWFKIIFS